MREGLNRFCELPRESLVVKHVKILFLCSSCELARNQIMFENIFHAGWKWGETQDRWKSHRSWITDIQSRRRAHEINWWMYVIVRWVIISDLVCVWFWNVFSTRFNICVRIVDDIRAQSSLCLVSFPRAGLLAGNLLAVESAWLLYCLSTHRTLQYCMLTRELTWERLESETFILNWHLMC